MLIGFIFRVTFLKKSSESSQQDDCYLVLLEAVVQRCSVKKVFLEISQNSQENSCASLFFNKVACLRSATLLKKNFAKFLRTPFFYRTPLVAASVLLTVEYGSSHF